MTKKITLLDGAVGTSLWEKSQDKVPVWRYNLENPQIVTELHKEYIAAGSEIILANTFGANVHMVRRSPYSVREVVSAGMRLAKDAAEGTGVKVAMAVGPLSVLMEPYGDLEEDEAAEIFREQMTPGVEQGADLVMLQTFMDIEMMRVAITVAKEFGLPVMATMTFEKTGKTMMGNSVEKIVRTMEDLGVAATGMNCSLGPDLALPILKEFASLTQLPLIFKPNAGKPILASDGGTTTPYTASTFAREVTPAAEFAGFIGGCCGCNASFVRELKKSL